MLYTKKNFYDNGKVPIAGLGIHPWRYCHTVDIIIHEKTETFSAPAIFGKERMCLHDLKRRCRQKFRLGAIAEVRRKLVAQLPVTQPLPELEKEIRLDLSQV
jgi:hypothetical protein